MTASCLLCPRGRSCRGFQLHEMLLRLCDAASAGGGADEVAGRLTRADAELLAEKGDAARRTCWTKAFVLTMSAKIASAARAAENEHDLRCRVERIVVRMDSLFSRLPSGIVVDLAEMSMDVFNETMRHLSEDKAGGAIAAAVAAQVGSQAVFRRSLKGEGGHAR